ncbi:TPA: hypothetical protein HA241_06705 [Candidatus Woesearchaeota archaeon]|nr:hypothetical protein [Candidatus Woesearchaeota archaeon]
MNKKASADYIKLRKLINDGYVPGNINIKITPTSEETSIELRNAENKTIALQSFEGDVVLFAFSVKQVFNKQGLSMTGEVKDLGLFYETLEKFYDPDNKKYNDAVSQVISSKNKIEYVPHDLLKRFLEDPATSSYRQYLKLRDDYYVIKFLHVELLKQVYAGLLSIRNQKSLKTKIFDTTLDLFKKAFHHDPNFVKNYQLFQKYNKADATDLLISSSEDLDHDKDKFDMLSKRNGTPAKQGLKYVIESYATLAETVIKILNIIRAAIEIEEGVTDPLLNKGSVDNWLKIKENKTYGFIVEDFDPRIRHGKAHNNYNIDVTNNKIDFYKEGRIKDIAFSYTFEEFRKMWHRLHLLLSALVVAVCVEQAALTGAMLESGEYKLLLASMGNFKEIRNKNYV